MPYGLFDYGGTINTMGASPSMCPDGGIPTLTTYKDPKLGNRDIGFGKGINGSFKCPPPPPKCAPTMKTGNCLYKLA